MYHLELHQFPHHTNRFNLAEEDLRAVVEPWVREQPVELGERRWSPHQARITILQGPQLAIQELSMGRGWGAAQRRCQDVTASVLASAAEALRAQVAEGPKPAADASAASGADPLSLGVQIAGLLGPDPLRLLDAWRAVAAQEPALAPSESLARAERGVGSAEMP